MRKYIESKKVSKSRTVDLVIPVFNEEKCLPLFWRRINSLALKHSKYNWNFIFINDGSTDGSRDFLVKISNGNKRVSVINFSRNFGHQAAITAGLDFSTSKTVCVIDADLQDPPELLIKMLSAINSGYNIAYGLRTHREGESIFKIVTAKLFYRILSIITEVEIPVDTGDFRAMDRKVVSALCSMREKHRFIRGMVAWAGFRSKAIPYEREARLVGITKYPFRKMLKFALDAIYSFSDWPLRVATMIGSLIGGFGFLGIFYILWEAFFHKNYLPGSSASLFAILAIGGVQLLCLGFIGQYIGRIFNESKKRPLYLVDSILNKKAIYCETEKNRRLDK
jgi:dolichol-phosphate mannosyltransferase